MKDGNAVTSMLSPGSRPLVSELRIQAAHKGTRNACIIAAISA